jgi:hypothetical protein
VAVKHLSNSSQDVPELLGCGFISQAEGVTKPDLVSQGEIVNTHRGELTVGDRDDGSGEGPNSGGAEADRLDPTLVFSHPAKISDPDGLIGNDGDSADQVFQRFLSGQSYGNTANAQPGNYRSQIDTRDVKNEKGADYQGQKLGQLVPKMDE